MTGVSLVRVRLLDVVERRPGLTLSALRKTMALGWGSLYHHLRNLRNAGLVRIAAAGRVRLVFPANVQLQPEECQVLHVLEAPAARALLMAIDAGVARDVPALEGATGVKERAVYYHLKRLHAVGAVVSTSDTRYRDLRATPRASALLRVATRAKPLQ